MVDSTFTFVHRSRSRSRVCVSHTTSLLLHPISVYLSSIQAYQPHLNPTHRPNPIRPEQLHADFPVSQSYIPFPFFVEPPILHSHTYILQSPQHSVFRIYQIVSSVCLSQRTVSSCAIFLPSRRIASFQLSYYHSNSPPPCPTVIPVGSFISQFTL